jgi:hypothetical protein
MSIRRLPFAVALLALAAACSSTAPPDVRPAEVYVLVSIDGRQLPTTWSNDPGANGVLILQEQLILDDLGVGIRNTTVQGSTPNTETTSSRAYHYTRVGDVVTLGDFICTGNVPCVNHLPEQGTTDGNILTLTPVPILGAPSGPVLVYRSTSFVD